MKEGNKEEETKKMRQAFVYNSQNSRDGDEERGEELRKKEDKGIDRRNMNYKEKE